jgi:hypothetical protein
LTAAEDSGLYNIKIPKFFPRQPASGFSIVRFFAND